MEDTNRTFENSLLMEKLVMRSDQVVKIRKLCENRLHNSRDKKVGNVIVEELAEEILEILNKD